MFPLSIFKFDCDRTCPLHEKEQQGRFMCRFNPLFVAFSPTTVCSHTAKLKADYHRDPTGLKAAVEAMGGTWIGDGTHRLYGSAHKGYGFRLPGWDQPLVASADGELYYDDFQGNWGDVADLDKLRDHFFTNSAVLRAQSLGWQCEVANGVTTIYHPDGGSITIHGDQISTSGFMGTGCHEAREQLGLPVTDVVDTIEASQIRAEVEESE